MKRNKSFVVTLPMELWFELIDAAAECYQKDETRDCTPESFAVDCICSVLADRRIRDLRPNIKRVMQSRPDRSVRVARADELAGMTA